jgi:hypothetical protein
MAHAAPEFREIDIAEAATRTAWRCVQGTDNAVSNTNISGYIDLLKFCVPLESGQQDAPRDDMSLANRA